jgi:hypothetical protein
MKSGTKAQAIRAINKRGALLVFPLNNRKEPSSIWSEFYPRSKMRWEWDQGGDTRVSDLWFLREQLSRSRQVIYAKWYQGRAMVFSKQVLVHLLAYLRTAERVENLAPDSRNMLDLLVADSPLSTRQLKAAMEMEGRLFEPTFNRTIKPLWNLLAIVGFGEFEDSSFPSLGIGATQTLFEELWLEAASINPNDAFKRLQGVLGASNPFLKYAQKQASSVASHTRVDRHARLGTLSPT